MRNKMLVTILSIYNFSSSYQCSKASRNLRSKFRDKEKNSSFGSNQDIIHQKHLKKTKKEPNKRKNLITSKKKSELKLFLSVLKVSLIKESTFTYHFIYSLFANIGLIKSYMSYCISANVQILYNLHMLREVCCLNFCKFHIHVLIN